VESKNGFHPVIQQVKPKSVYRVYFEKNGKREYLDKLVADSNGRIRLPFIKLANGKSIKIFVKDSKQKVSTITFVSKTKP
jgi:hypothetical protein